MKAIYTQRTKQLQLANSDGEILFRECRTCKEIKSVNEFGKYKAGHYRPDCRPCHNDRQREYISQNNARRRAYSANQRARMLYMPEGFSESDFLELSRFANGRCMVSGLKSDNLVLDHIQALNRKMFGSTKINLWLVSAEVNSAKKDMKLGEFMVKRPDLVDRSRVRESLAFLAEINGMTANEYIKALDKSERYADALKKIKEDKKHDTSKIRDRFGQNSPVKGLDIKPARGQKRSTKTSAKQSEKREAMLFLDA